MQNNDFLNAESLGQITFSQLKSHAFFSFYKFEPDVVFSSMIV